MPSSDGGWLPEAGTTPLTCVRLCPQSGADSLSGSGVWKATGQRHSSVSGKQGPLHTHALCLRHAVAGGTLLLKRPAGFQHSLQPLTVKGRDHVVTAELSQSYPAGERGLSGMTPGLHGERQACKPPACRSPTQMRSKDAP